MKKLALTFMLLLTSNVVSAESQMAMCEKEGQKFGDGTGKDSIPSECSDLFLKNASKKMQKKSTDEKVSVFAYKNIVFIKDPTSKMKGQNIIAGKYTELEDIKAIAFDETNKEIAVLEKSGDIFFFSSVITGNVAPKRTIKHKELDGASDLTIYKDKLIVLNTESEEIHVFSRLANINGPENKKQVAPLKSFEKVKGDSMKIDPEKEEISVEDPETKVIATYQLSKN